MGNLTDFIGGQHYTDAAGTIQSLSIEVLTEAAYTILVGTGLNSNTLYLITNVA